MYKMNGSFVIDRVRLRWKRRAKFMAADNIEKNDNFRALVRVDAVRPRDKRARIKPSESFKNIARTRARGRLTVCWRAVGRLPGPGSPDSPAARPPWRWLCRCNCPTRSCTCCTRASAPWDRSCRLSPSRRRSWPLRRRSRANPGGKTVERAKKKKTRRIPFSCRTPETTTNKKKVPRVSSKYRVVVINY